MCGSDSAGQDGAVSAEAEHGEGDESVGGGEPKAILVMSWIFWLTDSIRPLDRPCSTLTSPSSRRQLAAAQAGGVNRDPYR
jgi:hypothetical protein